MCFVTSLHAAASLTRTMLRVSSIAPTARPIDTWKWHDTTPAPPPAFLRWRIDRIRLTPLRPISTRATLAGRLACC
jgi:hypothetical protein